MRKFHWTKQFNWRILLIRLVVNALILLVIATLLPDIYVSGNNRLFTLIVLALVMGVVNALIRPLLEFLTLTFIFATYGIVVILINTVILLILDWLVKDFVIDSWFWAFVGGALMGLVGSALESLFGVIPPILPEKFTKEKARFAPQVLPTSSMILQKIEPKAEHFAPLPGPNADDMETKYIQPGIKPVQPEPLPEPQATETPPEVPTVAESDSSEEAAQ